MISRLCLASCAAALLVASPVLAEETAPETAAPAAEAPAPPPVPESQATPAPAPPAEPAAPAASSEPAAPAEEGPSGPIAIGPAPAGKAQIVFWRPSTIVGVAIPCNVHEAEPVVGKLAAGKYFVRVVDPGVHDFMVQSEAKDRLKLEVEDGETYYVKCSISMGIMVGRPNLSPSNKAAFDKAAKSLKPSKPVA